jgi:ABC-2 type transport system ATP-binding protein
VAAVIEISNLTKDYELGFIRKRKVRALDSLSLSVEEGETFGFLGANGAGKTTTLKLLMRLIYPSGGQAKILGKDINDISMHQRIGYLPENPYFYDYLSARELVRYFASLFGITGKERDAKVAEVLHRVYLDEKKWDTQLRKFSKGMLQRVGLAQALINDPEIVFLDEPMSGLDPIGRRQVRDLITDLKNRGTTVFMCSHILSDIEVLCDRVAIMNRGKLAATGRLDELRSKQSDEQGFEITVTGTDTETLAAGLNCIAGASVTTTPSGVRVLVSAESNVDEVMLQMRKLGGQLVSVQPVRQSLEELFFSQSDSEQYAQK